MTELIQPQSRRRKPAPQPTVLVTPHAIYAAVLQGVMANPNILHDVEKTTALAERYADRMCERDRGR